MRTINARFESGSEGFSTTGLALSGFQPTGGHPDGFFQYTDLGLFDVNYYRASDEFTGHKQAFFGGKLAYQVYDSGSADVTGEADVQLVGQNGVTLVAKVGQAGNDWTHMSIRLDTAGGWHIDSLDGSAATNSQIRQVLKDVDQLLVRADYSSGLDTGGLDDLKLTQAKHHSDAPQGGHLALSPHAFAGDAATIHGVHADIGHPALAIDAHSVAIV